MLRFRNLFKIEAWFRFLVLWAILISGTSAEISVRVFMFDEGLSDQNMSKPRIYVQNTGDEALNNFTYYYYFQTENGIEPLLNPYYLSPYTTVSLQQVATGYRLIYTVTGANLAPGATLPGTSGNSVGLNHQNWSPWDKANDFSNNLSSTFQENQNISVYINVVKIYGNDQENITIPISPGTLSASAISSQRIDLSWIDNSDNETGFRIEMSSNGVDFSETGTVTANVTSYQSTGLSANTSYSYRISAYNSAGNSAYSNTTSAKTLQNVPVTPASLSANAISHERIDLVWSDNSDNENGFRIERALDGITFTEIASVAANVTTFQNIGLLPGTQYTYRVRAYNDGGNSGYSPVTAATTHQTIPIAPSSLTANVISFQRIDLSWTDNSNNETGFRIERSLNGGTYSEIGTVSADITSYQSTSLSGSTSYSFRIRAYNSAGNSDYSTEISATTQQAPDGFISRELWTNVTGTTVSDIPITTTPSSTGTLTSLEAPSNIGDNYAQRLRGYITAPASGQYTFWVASDDHSELWLSTDDQPLNKVKIASVSGYTGYREWNKYSSQKSSVINLTEGVKYYVEILHKEGSGEDYLSIGWLKPGQSGTVPSEIVPGNLLSGYVELTPASPSSLTANVISFQRIDLSWTDNSDNETGFKIERSSNGGTYSEIGTVSANVTLYQSTSLSGSTSYSFRILAYNSAGNSDYSTEISATTPQAPDGFISRELWTNVTGTTVSDIPITTTPSSTGTLTSLEAPSNIGDNYAQRLRGYITAPASGQYTFWVASDDHSELWLSTDDQPSNKIKISSVSGYTGYREWNKYSSQKSSAISLSEGVKYYVEILHKEGYGGDNLSIGWLKPGQSGTVPSEVVPGIVLSPYATPVPNAPDNLFVNTISSTQLNLSWTDNSNNETGFRVERAQGSGDFTQIAEVPANTVTYQNAGLNPSTEYRYRVLAYNDQGNSSYSNTVTAVTLSQPVSGLLIPPYLLDFAVYSHEQSILSDGSSFTGGGSIGSNGYIEAGASTVVNGDLVSCGNILLRSQSTINGNVIANGTVTLQDGAVANEILEGAANSTITLPQVASITVGTQNITVASGQVLELAPGMYNALIVESGGTLKLSAGTYTFSSIMVRPDGIILYDMSMYDELEIFVQNDIEFSDRSHIEFAGGDTYAPSVKIYANDPNILRLGTQVRLTGIILAPHAEVQIFDGTTLNGAIYARKVVIEAVAGIESGTVNPEGDPDNDFVPSFPEYKLHTDPYDPLDYTAIAIPDPSMIDNSSEQTVSFDFSRFFGGYSRATGVEVTFPAGSLTDPSSPVLFQIRNMPSSAPEYNEIDFIPIGRYMEPVYNSLVSGMTVSIGVPLPDNTVPGARYKIAIYRSGAWEELDGTIGEQAVYADITGDLGPMILVQKPANAVYYFDNSVYSHTQVSKIDIDIIIHGSTNTAEPAGTFTLNYTDFSQNASGTDETITLDFGRRPNGSLVARGTYTIYGRVVVTSANILVATPDSVNYPISENFDIDKGQSLHISTDKNISAINGASNIPDKLVFTYGADNLAYEYTGIDGEGQIRQGSGGTYNYNYYLKDHLGTTRMVMTDDGDITEAIMYQPYGTMEELSEFASSADPAREKFTGKEFDKEGENDALGIKGMGLFYFGARYYDTEIGVFTSSDPILQYWNVYSYTGGNPVNFIDPTGMAAVTSSAADDEAAFILSQSQEGLDLAAWAEGVDADINYSTLLDMHNLVADANATYQNAQAMNAFNNLMFGNDISREMGVVINLANMGANFFPPAKLVTIPLAYSHMAIEQAIRHRQGLGVDGTGLAVNFTLTTMSTVSGFGFGMAGKTGAVLSTGYDATLWGVNELSNSVRNSPPTRR